MEWITPKTDWQMTDKINLSDYYRWRNNLLFLKRYCYSIFHINYDSMANNKVAGSYPYADEINAIENNLDKLNKGKYNLSIGSKKTYSENKGSFNYMEINRIETAMLELYVRIGIDRKPLDMMQFTLGKQKGFRP